MHEKAAKIDELTERFGDTLHRMTLRRTVGGRREKVESWNESLPDGAEVYARAADEGGGGYQVLFYGEGGRCLKPGSVSFRVDEDPAPTSAVDATALRQVEKLVSHMVVMSKNTDTRAAEDRRLSFELAKEVGQLKADLARAEAEVEELKNGAAGMWEQFGSAAASAIEQDPELIRGGVQGLKALFMSLAARVNAPKAPGALNAGGAAQG